MPLKKSELYSSIWKSCDELRGGMDASQYKDYVLVLLFVKYVSDKAASQRGYELKVPPGAGFDDLVALKGGGEIGDGMNKVIGRLAEANGLVGIIDVADFNDADKLGKGKEMQDRLSNLIGIFQNPALDFRGNRAEGDDLLGDAYEYLMRHFATESGKSKGQFYTPAEVSRIMAKVVGLGEVTSTNQTIHDPTAGSGSLLIRAHDEAKHQTGLDLAVYGQEKDSATRALARMNAILHDLTTAEVQPGNSLTTPAFLSEAGGLKTFDFVVANPPFSDKAWSNGFKPAEDLYQRFAFGIPPAKNGDFAFLLHVLACLKSTGKGAIILPHGVLFRGGAEAKIRRELVRRGLLQGIIGLPANLFYGTGIPACIVVIDKAGAASRDSLFLIDASRGFRKDGPKNRLREQDIHKIVDTFTRELELPGYSRRVRLSEIADAKNDFNLNLPRYIDSSEPEDVHDIDGHLRGGIPERDLDALEPYWRVLPGVSAALFEPADRPGYRQLRLPVAEVKAAIFGHAEFTAFRTAVLARFERWRTDHLARLKAITLGVRPKLLLEEISEPLLSGFADAPLLDAYDVYQRLMDFWAAVMQDDVALLAEKSWLEAAKPRLLVESKEQKSREAPDFVLGKQKFKSDLVPAPLVIARWLTAEQGEVDRLEAELAAVEQELAEQLEEHGGEGGLFEEVVEGEGEKRKIPAARVKARLRELRGDEEAAEERQALEAYAALETREAELRMVLKAARETLVKKLAARYGELTEDEVKVLVVEDKWLAALEREVEAELDRVSQALTGRIRELAERYEKPLPRLMAEVEELTARVAGHLERMGAVWS